MFTKTLLMALTLGLLFFPHMAKAEMPLELIAEFDAAAGAKCLSPGDINADGYSEVFAFDAEISNRLIVYSGNDPQDTLPVMTIDNVLDFFWIADINGDGYDDFALQKAKIDLIERVEIWYGGENFLEKTEPDLVFLDNNGIDGNTGKYINSGDITGDGQNDLIIGAPTNLGGEYYEGMFFIHYGGTSIDTITDAQIRLHRSYIWPCTVELCAIALGDINGDNLTDLAFNQDQMIGEEEFYISIIFGNQPLDTLPSSTLRNPFDYPGNSWDYGRAISLLGDINQDGYDDFIIGGEHCWPSVYLGGNPFNTDPIILGDTSEYWQSSDQTANIGDINVDGWDDIAIGHRGDGSNGTVIIYYGYRNINAEADLFLNYVGTKNIILFGSSVGPAGDFNGDGIDDIAITALENTGTKSARGKLFIYAGSSLLPTSVTDTRDNPVPNNHWFLNQNHPNPFNICTEITFSLTGNANRHVELNVYNILGQKVRTLTLGVLSPGPYVAIWNGFDDSGHIIGSGVYFCVLRSGDEVISRKMVCLK
jgi:hypothetical protein